MTIGYLRVTQGTITLKLLIIQASPQSKANLLFQKLNTLNTLPKVKPIPESLSSSGMTER